MWITVDSIELNLYVRYEDEGYIEIAEFEVFEMKVGDGGSNTQVNFNYFNYVSISLSNYELVSFIIVLSHYLLIVVIFQCFQV